MSDIALDLRSLVNAIDRLREGLARYQQDITDTLIRDGLIQRFEFTYEVSQKMLKRYLEMASATPEQFDSMPFADVIRTGNEQGLLLSDWPRWRQFRDMHSKPATPTTKPSPSMWWLTFLLFWQKRCTCVIN
jgi:nucleotidyltransferase substrate binding protein (TIGR01987 family)